MRSGQLPLLPVPATEPAAAEPLLLDGAAQRDAALDALTRARPSPFRGERDYERFWNRVEITDTCWLWRGSISGNGYGQMHFGNDGAGKTFNVHRLIYEEYVGPVPRGLELDHLCRVRCCVRLDHLEPVTHRVNTLRGDTLPARNFVKTHCDHGHPFDQVNTYRIRGERVCRICNRDRTRAYRRRKAGVAS